MSSSKKDKYDLLATVIDAVFDENNDVKIETTKLDALEAKKHFNFKETDARNPQIVTDAGDIRYGTFSNNRMNALSFKVGKISMRLLPDVKKFIIRTPEGEAEFKTSDIDVELIWNAALHRYDMEKSRAAGYDVEVGKQALSMALKHQKLRRIAEKPAVFRDTKKTKFDKAKEDLEALGIKASEEKLKKRLQTIKKKSFEK